MNKEDQERLLVLKARVWRKVAQKLLEGEEDPYLLDDYTIEGHRGRRDKAIRLLDGVIKFSHSKTSTGYHSSPEKTYTVLRLEESIELGTYPEFEKTWQEFHRDIFGMNFDEQAKFEIIGYECINSQMKDTDALYIYWHQDEFDTSTYNETTYYYPKVLKETRIKAMLRAIVENHFQKDFPRKLEKYLDLPSESFRDEGEFKIEPRNFAAYASSFTRQMYTGDKGYLEEYTHYRKYFEGLIQHLNTIDRMVKEKGGHAAIVKEMRLDSIQQLLTNAPLCINYIRDDKNRYGHDDEETAKYYSTYLLKHTDYFDYDILYAEDTTIEHIDGQEVSLLTEVSNYEPTEDTIKVVEDLEKERRACLAQMISEILPVTSKTVPTT